MIAWLTPSKLAWQGSVSRKLIASLPLIAVLGVGCLADEHLVGAEPGRMLPPPVVTDPDPDPPVDPPPMMMPAPPMAGPPLEVGLQRVFDRAARRVAVLGPGRLLIETSTTVVYIPSAGATPVDLGPSPMPVHGVATLEWGQVVVAGARAFYVLEPSGLVESPLTMALPLANVRQMRGVPGPTGAYDLWIATNDALHMWRSGQVFRLRPGMLPVDNAKLAWGAPVDGKLATWVASGSAIYGIVATTEGVTAYQSLDLEGYWTDAMAVDFEGTLWVASNGVLRSRSWDGSWYVHDLVTGVRDLAAHPDAHDLWIVTDEGLWHHKRGVFRPVVNAPAVTSITPTADGTALVIGDRAITRVFPGRSVRVEGLVDGSRLQQTTEVTIFPDAESAVSSVTIAVDGDVSALMGPPWSVSLDPDDFDDGTHRLAVDVEYGDGSPTVSVSVDFSVFHQPPPTWSDDIEPLFDDKCALCHGDGAGATARALHTPALFISEFDRILTAVADSRMPLPPNPPLSPEQIELIVGWRAAGYLE